MSDLAQRLQQRLAKVPGPGRTGRSDYDLNPHMPKRSGTLEALTDAAVLVPIIERQNELTVLLTQRAEGLPTHAGQISFPGGRRHREDRDLLETALRETTEEVGIDAEQIAIVGYLERYETGTGYCILPVVGLLADEIELILDPSEVAEAFEVPLDFLMDPANHQRHSYTRDGVTRHFYAMPYEDYYIWGATAGMLKMLYDRLYGS